MRLSRLHIAGFKSFPDRAELGFDTGVTAIVGPNGCGKSNVVDAITWVLGEQSAKSLRGDRMEDVIFNGSDARKPTGAAEVRLKLTQVAQVAQMVPFVAAPDANALLDAVPLVTRDVEIGRRLYRSGESEYLIDGEICRLRDVHDLLMDSGLGVKAYAVIEQGKIGQILASRPAERRMLIEEAAGVTKYKSRRRSAELKLEAAQQNLTRIDDIVFEVEKQRGALRRQAARARRYKRLREELRKWEQVQFARRYAALSRDIEAAEARLAEARAREAAASAHVAELEAALERDRLGLTEAEAAATVTREQAHAREIEIGRRQQQITFDRRQAEDLAGQAEAYAIEARDLEGRRDPAKQALLAQREAAARVREALIEVGGRVQDRVTDYNRALAAVQAVEQDADQMRAAVLAAATTLALLRQARDNAAAVRDRVSAECERLEIEARDLTAEAARARDQHAAATDALAAARNDHVDVTARRGTAEVDLTGVRSDRERAAQALALREREVAAASARLHSLEELEVSRATFGDAARLLLGDEGRTVRQHGAVADHLAVERSYERAVDALLGDLLQHVLVDQSSDVTAGLALLAERSAGRCGFVVLEDAKGQALADVPLVVPPGTRPLASVVRGTGPFAAVVSRLIGRALIVDSFDAARALARTVSVPVATMAGDVFRSVWLVQGGGTEGVRGILETRAETMSLRETVAAASEEVAGMRMDLARIDADVAGKDAALIALTAQRHDQEKTIVGLEAQQRHLADEEGRLGRRLEVVETEQGRAGDEQQASEQRRDDAAAAIETHESQQRDAETSLGGVLASLQTARDEAEQRMRLVNDSRTEEATLAERAQALDADVTRLGEAARELEDRIAGRRADVERTQGRRTDLLASITETERLLDDAVRAFETLRVDMRAADERVAECRDEFNRRDQAIRAARHTLDDVRSSVMQSEVARAKAAADLGHLGESCLESTGVAIDQVTGIVAAMDQRGELVAPSRRLSAADDESDGDESGAEPSADVDFDATAGGDDTPAVDPDVVIGDLRKKIERLGPVNMMAIEQFDELESRHTFLTTQRKDLLDSIAQTGEAIRKIDTTTRERFAQAFASINGHFEKTFTTLFGGGRAGLVLIDQENEPESGIDIIAQPPGKRLQNVQLLSGGEKALTAMALMFAIFKYRPSPFCLLDEIDAPLDDANIGRFVEMLAGMQAHTQFILITHNRKTMEIANRLYGVTMEEPGVSKLISLQLN